MIEGGPRCSPCFRLARWIEDQHATLDEDFVVVKLMAGIDKHVTEAKRLCRRPYAKYTTRHSLP